MKNTLAIILSVLALAISVFIFFLLTNNGLQNQIDQLKSDVIKSDTNLSKTISEVNSRFDKIEFKQICVDRKCVDDNYSRIQTPEGWIDTGIRHENTFPGGRCGKGKHCKVFYRIEK